MFAFRKGGTGTPPRRGRRRIRLILGLVGMLWITLGIFHLSKPLPEGISVSGPGRDVEGMKFLYDLTYLLDSEAVVRQEIFDEVLAMIDSAKAFIVIDMFLFNGEGGGDRDYRPISKELTDRLASRMRVDPDLKAVFITDEINNFYGAYTSSEIRRLGDAGVQVITTNLSRLRDSNPGFSAGWRMFANWFGTAGPGWLPHPLSTSGQKVTARSYLKLLNFKANHRKLIVTDQGCLVASANPHDASSFHSNIGFAGSGPICSDLLEGERAVASFSGAQVEDWPAFPPNPVSPSSAPEEGSVQVVTEGKILETLLADVGAAGAGDRVDLAMFYLSHRQVVKALLSADRRGAQVRIILDPNKDAFGREKGGIPNRQVAWELVHRSQGRISVRWYDTHGEQFHTKLIMVTRGGSAVIMGGSANLTRRNIGDYNLEADLRFDVPASSNLGESVGSYYQRLFENEGGGYTLPYEAYEDDGLLKRIRYRLEEFTGFCSY